eukprot:750532-Hanusia_phi.AAC.2
MDDDSEEQELQDSAGVLYNLCLSSSLLSPQDDEQDICVPQGGTLRPGGVASAGDHRLSFEASADSREDAHSLRVPDNSQCFPLPSLRANDFLGRLFVPAHRLPNLRHAMRSLDPRFDLHGCLHHRD